MNRLFLLTITTLLFFISSCTKDKFITDKNAFIVTSDTALHFDTVFSAAGSVTKQLKIFNINDQKLRISNLELMGGNNSFFKINVSGSAGTMFNDIDLAAGDSLYVFVTVNAPANNQQLPFLIQDSIRIAFNGNTQYVQLDAYGQNAHFLRNVSITHDTTWTNDLPYVLLDSFSVAADATLTIEKGVRIFCHANTPFYVDGSLRVNGDKDTADRVVFASDRLDAPYKDQPGTWEGLYFGAGSSDNVLNYTLIKNAKQGIAADNASRVSLNQCIIDNCPAAGIIAYNSTLKAANCLISNCSSNVYIIGGGNYAFAQCTIASYNTQYFYHQYPVLSLSSAGSSGTDINPLRAVFRNCIIYGESNNAVAGEIAVDRQGNSAFDVVFEHTLYSSPAENPSATYINCLTLNDPFFKTIDTEKDNFDFHLQPSSPCVNAGAPSGINIDLDGNPRDAQPDIGCYEAKP
ncbi:hypothetical protein FC093_13245 [Ilyomonas limi]|uniref:Right-handed parallel beta-helix repeat-containing protein n=1 Tax=Ilyomonas limi TaxID=2575867 RepID=A0A4U3KYB8_9BACT|nr:right-handed parallel beta-helix repeat-containing protein [Ilyomonas limi]TKK67711.1 hypothetical protein FC093_13245 [Ilyomonas limi]